MLIPSRTKYRRVHRLPYDGKAKGNKELHFGTYRKCISRWECAFCAFFCDASSSKRSSL